ncbi:hypothetical protein DTO271G3_5940 [Paecilomyces variotii]|nr:hypothetical protein DTO271G3_5940 [Paecilomyces variotii]
MQCHCRGSSVSAHRQTPAGSIGICSINNHNDSLTMLASWAPGFETLPVCPLWLRSFHLPYQRQWKLGTASPACRPGDLNPDHAVAAMITTGTSIMEIINYKTCVQASDKTQSSHTNRLQAGGEHSAHALV